MTRSYASGVASKPLIGETIGENFERTVARFGEREALVVRHQDVRLTYAELNERVDALARGLLGAGLRKGDRLGIWAPNCAEWVLTQYATAKAGIILVNVNPAYRTTELRYALDQSGCRMLVAATAFKTSDYAAMIEEVRGDLPELEQVVLLGSPEWEALLAGDGPEPDLGALDSDDPINIQYTSGTTGFPKGATLSHHNILNNAFFVGEGCGYDEHDRVCIPVPFYHCFGMVMGNLGCTTHGAAMVVPESAFEPAAVLAAVQEERCTSLYGVPTMFIAQLNHPDFEQYDLSQPAHRDHGRVAVPDRGHEAGDRAHAHGRGDHLLRHDGDLAGVDADRGRRLAREAHADGRPRPPAPRGQADRPRDRRHRPARRAGRAADPRLQRHGRLLERPRARRPRRSTTHGWMHTGDLATMDEDGYLNIVGRSKDMVIRGGENIYPREVEEFLHTHPDVLEAAVIGVPDERYGEELMAWIRLREGAALVRGRRALLLRGQDRPLQGAALRAVRRRVPDDRHRQGAEVQDARAGDRRARPARATDRVRGSDPVRGQTLCRV